MVSELASQTVLVAKLGQDTSQILQRLQKLYARYEDRIRFAIQGEDFQITIKEGVLPDNDLALFPYSREPVWLAHKIVLLRSDGTEQVLKGL